MEEKFKDALLLNTGDIVVYDDGGELAVNGKDVKISWLTHPEKIVAIKKPIAYLRTDIDKIEILTKEENKENQKNSAK